MTSRQLISPQEIQQKIDEIAIQIAKEYQGQPVVLVGVLGGAFMVLADFARSLWRAGHRDIAIDFVKTSSYVNEATESTRHPKIALDLSTSITGKHVLIVEDIADTGHTLKLLQNHLGAEKPSSLKTFALLNKSSRREVEVYLDYVGFEIDGWIEGYGLDSTRACPAVMVRE